MVATIATLAELPEALALAFAVGPYDERRERAARALTLMRAGDIDPAGVWVVRGPRGLVGACVGAVLPARGAVIWPPGGSAAVATARAVTAWLQTQGCCVAQALVATDELVAARPLLDAGFHHVGGMLYLDHFLDLPASVLAKRPRLQFRTYTDAEFDLWAEVLGRTYKGSGDMPELHGLRTPAEMLAGHRLAVGFVPDQWWLGCERGNPVGLLLALTDDANGWEVTYVGVVPERRGCGFGKELVVHCLAEAKADGRSRVGLAVDARNVGAERLYRRLGFSPCERREVLLRVFP